MQSSILEKLSKFSLDDKYTLELVFFFNICKGWINGLRINQSKKIGELLEVFLSRCHEKLIPILLSITHNSSWAIEVDKTELELIYSLADKFEVNQNQYAVYIAIISGIAHYDWNNYKKVIEVIFDKLVSKELFETLDNCINAMVSNFRYLYKRDSISEIPSHNVEWLGNQINKLSQLNSHVVYSISEILKGRKLSICWYLQSIRNRITYKSNWNNDKFGIIPYERYTQFVKSINSSDENDRKCFKEIVKLIVEKPAETYFLDQEIHLLDPNADELPEIMSEILKKLDITNKEDRISISFLSKIIGSFNENSSEWRQLGRIILIKTLDLDSRSKNNIMTSLKGTKGTSYASKIDEVSPDFYDQVKRINKRKEEENDHVFNSYWNFRLNNAKYQLQLEEEKLREEELEE